MSRFSVLVLALAGTFGASAAVPEFLMSKAVRMPRTDGVISSGEYVNAVTFSGAADYRGAAQRREQPIIDSRLVECAMTWSEKSLHVAVRMRIDGDGKLLVADKFTNPAMGDSVELWLSPPPEARVGEFARFGQFQLVVDSSGRMHAWQYNPGYGLASRKWRPEGIVARNCIHCGIWDCEIEIPATAFGAQKIVPDDWKILPCVNIRSKPSVQATFVPFAESAGYVAESGYSVFHLVEKRKSSAFGGEPKLLPRGVRIPVPGAVAFKVRTISPVPANRYMRFFGSSSATHGYWGLQREAAYDGRQLLHLFYHAPARKKLCDFRSSALPDDGDAVTYVVNVEPERLTVFADGVRLGEVKPDVPIDSKTLGEFVLGGGEGSEMLTAEIHPKCLTDEEIRTLATSASGVSGSLKWYPSRNLLAAELVCDGAIAGKDLHLSVADAAGRSLGRWRLPRDGAFVTLGGKKKTVVIHDVFHLDRIPPDGVCRAELVASGASSPLMVKTFESRQFPWFGTEIGRRERLLPGFTPVVVTGKSVETVGRRYEFGDDGFPKDVISLGQSILARKIALAFERDGRTTHASGGHLSFGRRTATAAEYESLGGDVVVRGRVEQDGFLLLDLTFPEKGEWDRIYLDVPLKAEYADLYHACGEATRSNPAGALPKGPGRVFGSRKIPQTHIENFIPYCWFGTDDRGIYYAADVDRGWLHAKDRDAVEIFRESDGTAVMRLNLINGRYVAKGGRHIELALGATPVKPRPAGWRDWADTYIDWPCSRTMLNLASSATWNSFYGWMARYPAFADFDHVRKLTETVRTGVIDRNAQSNFIARCERAYRQHPSDVPTLADKPAEAARKTLVNHVQAAFNFARMLHGKSKAALYYYTCDCDPATKLPEWRYLSDEWGRHSQVFGSYQDYAVYYLDKMLAAGMGGVYNDNSYAWCNYDWVNGRAWIDEKGEVHPSLSIWALREFCRRQVVTMLDRGIEPWLTVHQTNANLLPAFAFATATMGMEWKYGSSEYQDRYTPDYIRAVNQGLQGGFFPTCLEGIFDTHSLEEKRHLGRTLLAAFLPHEVRPTLQRTIDARLYNRLLAKMHDFGVSRGDCVYTAYWDRANPVVSDRKDVLVSAYRRGDKLLLVLGSWADADVRPRLKFPAAVRSAVDVETDRAIDLDKLVIPRREFAVIEVTLAAS